MAARHAFRWWRPPTRGSAMTLAFEAGCFETGRVLGQSLANAK